MFLPPFLFCYERLFCELWEAFMYILYEIFCYTKLAMWSKIQRFELFGWNYGKSGCGSNVLVLVKKKGMVKCWEIQDKGHWNAPYCIWNGNVYYLWIWPDFDYTWRECVEIIYLLEVMKEGKNMMEPTVGYNHCNW